MAIWTIASVLIFRDVSSRMGPQVRVAAVQPGLDNAMPGTLISAAPTTGRTEDQRNDDQIKQLTAMTRDAAAQGATVVLTRENDDAAGSFRSLHYRVARIAQEMQQRATVHGNRHAPTLVELRP